MAGEAQMLARQAEVVTELVAPPLVDGDRVAIHWRFTFTSKKGHVNSFQEIAWQEWRGDRIWRETFFYDPGQTRRAESASRS